MPDKAEGASLGTLNFVDPQLRTGRPFERVEAVSSNPLPRQLDDRPPLQASIAGLGRERGLPEWTVETHTTSLLVIDGPLGDGRLVHEWYADDVGPESMLLGASMTKSVLAHLVAVALDRGELSLADRVVDHVPELAGTGYAACTVDHVMTMTTGTDWTEDHRDPLGPASRLLGAFLVGGSSRTQLTQIGPQEEPGTRWNYSTADSQVLDWVRERASGATYIQALQQLWSRLGCVREGLVCVDDDGVALAGGGLAACAEDWLRLAAVQLDGAAYGQRVLPQDWVSASSAPAHSWTAPGRLPVGITSHAGFGRHWWPLDDEGSLVTADGSRGQFGFVDQRRRVAVVKTSLWSYRDPWFDRAQRDLCYLGLPLIAAAAARPSTHPTHQEVT